MRWLSKKWGARMHLNDWLISAWEAFEQVGGTPEMFLATLFGNPSQAYYAGQVVAFRKVLDQVDGCPQAEAERANDVPR